MYFVKLYILHFLKLQTAYGKANNLQNATIDIFVFESKNSFMRAKSVFCLKIVFKAKGFKKEYAKKKYKLSPVYI